MAMKIVFVGKTGVGKTTCIKSLCPEVTAVAEGYKPVRNGIVEYQHRTIQGLTVVDTEGFEADGTNGTCQWAPKLSKIEKAILAGNDNAARIVCYCVNEGSRRFEDFEATIISRLSAKAKVIVVITQSMQGENFKDSVQLQLPEGTPIVRVRVLDTKLDDGGVYPSMALDGFVQTLADCVHDAVKITNDYNLAGSVSAARWCYAGVAGIVALTVASPLHTLKITEVIGLALERAFIQISSCFLKWCELSEQDCRSICTTIAKFFNSIASRIPGTPVMKILESVLASFGFTSKIVIALIRGCVGGAIVILLGELLVHAFRHLKGDSSKQTIGAKLCEDLRNLFSHQIAPIPVVAAPSRTLPQLALEDLVLDPITFETMTDPVTCADGYTYNQTTVQMYILSPFMPGTPLGRPVPSHAMRRLLELFEPGAVRPWHQEPSELGPAAVPLDSDGAAGHGAEQAGIASDTRAAVEALTLDYFSGQVMTDPVACADGHVYDRSSVERNHASPRTGLPLADLQFVPCRLMRELVALLHPDVEIAPYRS